MMNVLKFELRFTTPAFLGDTEQNGRWRTPPIKHLLREWWRVTYAADKNFSVDLGEMRREEGLLFGNAWLSHREGEREVADHSQSLVRLRLSQWDQGGLKKGHWPRDASVIHPEVTNRDDKPVPIGSALYLGYGPLMYDGERHEAHSQSEERWFTLGMTAEGKLLAVSHTFEQTTPTRARIRIISARGSTRGERKDYQETPR
jgi:uncharacterized DUF497 family protein